MKMRDFYLLSDFHVLWLTKGFLGVSETERKVVRTVKSVVSSMCDAENIKAFECFSGHLDDPFAITFSFLLHS